MPAGAASPGSLVRDFLVPVRTQVAIATALQDVRDEQCIVALAEAELIQSIVGREADEILRRRAPGSAGEPVLTVTGLTAGPVLDVSLEVRGRSSPGGRAPLGLNPAEHGA